MYHAVHLALHCFVVASRDFTQRSAFASDRGKNYFAFFDYQVLWIQLSIISRAVANNLIVIKLLANLLFFERRNSLKPPCETYERASIKVHILGFNLGCTRAKTQKYAYVPDVTRSPRFRKHEHKTQTGFRLLNKALAKPESLLQGIQAIAQCTQGYIAQWIFQAFEPRLGDMINNGYLVTDATICRCSL
jgi:hypothetical protein